MTTTITFEDDEGNERTLPAKFVVCPRCEGHGTHLHEAIGSHAYTWEEFHESFDDEEAEEYFRRGGRYDVPCTECRGQRVVAVVDEEACQTPEQKEALELYEEKLAADAAYERECAAERRMGC